jgi:choline dehydrogenase-like flavoprotein
MTYTRGSSSDFDRYAEVTGDDGWSWDAMLPYFRKNERWTQPKDGHNISNQFNPDVHGFDGVTSVSLAGYPSGIDDIVFQAANELNGDYAFNLDVNSGNPLGIGKWFSMRHYCHLPLLSGWLQSTINYDHRDSARTSYLASEYADRDNLKVVTNTRATRVLSSGTADDGTPEFKIIEFTSSQGGEKRTLTAKKEVILSAGAIGTPSILLYSGIGASSELSDLGINPVVDLPSVGKNLTDHPLMTNKWLVNSTDTRDDFYRNSSAQNELLASYFAGDGKFLVRSPESQVGFARIDEDHPIYVNEHDPSAGPLSPHYEFLTVVSLTHALCTFHSLDFVYSIVEQLLWSRRKWILDNYIHNSHFSLISRNHHPQILRPAGLSHNQPKLSLY